MKRILLCCAAGMSTSLLVTKMEKAAQEQGIETKIWAVSAGEVNEEIKEADVLLVGPQVRYLLPDMKKIAEEQGIQADSINMVHYGMCDGAAVLKTAVDMIEGK